MGVISPFPTSISAWSEALWVIGHIVKLMEKGSVNISF
jgi:hypothetical protein